MKGFLLIALLFIATVSFSQTTCGISAPQLYAKVKLPVKSNQVIDTLSFCDEDRNQIHNWTCTPTKEFKIIKDTKVESLAYLIVNGSSGAKLLNKAGNKIYVLDIKVSDGQYINPRCTESVTVTK